MKKILKTVFILTIILTIVLSSTIHTIISKRNLDVQTKMSDTIWLEPAAANQKTIFVKVSNTSGKNLNIEQKIISVLSAKGYRIVNDPAEAKYWLQANILKVDKDASVSKIKEILDEITKKIEKGKSPANKVNRIYSKIVVGLNRLILVILLQNATLY